jgi:hypothetical protein
MRISSRWTRRQIACILATLFAGSFAIAAPAPLQEPGSTQETPGTPPSQTQAQNSDDQSKKPDSNTASSTHALPDSPNPVQQQSTDQRAQTSTSNSDTEQEPSGAPKPVGTAAAPLEKTTGVAVSRPAGAVIAPAKQRRARTILIRVSLVVGGAVAVGTVVALSHGSPSRP